MLKDLREQKIGQLSSNLHLQIHFVQIVTPLLVGVATEVMLKAD
jgi:hypothetical protein